MKRCYFGAGLLILLLAAGIAVTFCVARCQEPIVRDLEQAALTALREDWEQTGSLTRSAKDQWQRWWKFSASVTDHSPMEAIDVLFSRLDVCLSLRNRESTAALCAELARQVEAIAEAHRLNWWNLL